MPASSAHADPPARSGGRAGRRRQAGGDPGLHGGRQDRHGVEGDRRRLRNGSLPRRVRRHRAGEQPAPRGRGDHRRAGRRQVLRRRSRRAGVLRRGRRRAAPARGAARRAGARRERVRRGRWPPDERRRPARRRASQGCWTASPSCRATSRSPTSRRTAAPRARQRLPRRARHAASTASSTRRRRWPTARARCCGSRRRWPWCPTCRRRSWSRRCRACASTPARSPTASSARRRRELAVAGITGTNGKTTCAYLLAQALEAAGRPAAYMGTIGTRPSAARSPRARSPPATRSPCSARWRSCAPTARRASRWKSPRTRSTRRASARCVSAPPRSPTSRATISTITARWTATAPPRRGCSRATDLVSRVINVDDAVRPPARHRSARPRPPRRHAAAATSRTRAAPPASCAPCTSSCRTRGIELEFDSSWGTGALAVPAGRRLQRRQPADRHRRAARLGHAARAASSRRWRGVRAAPGRMETFGGVRAPLAVVDYAHTPDALRKALRAARAHCAGRLVVVFGCGGDRDPRQAAAHGRDRRASSPTTSSSPTTIRAASRRGDRRATSPRVFRPASRFASSTTARARSARRSPTPAPATWC